MTLQEIFDALHYGELSQLDIGGDADRGISPEKQAQLVSHINLGLAALHRRFLLKTGRTTIQCEPGVSQYSLADVADMIKIEQIYAPDPRHRNRLEELHVNRTGMHWNVDMPSFKEIVVPGYLQNAELVVCYRATPAAIIRREDQVFRPAEVEVELPGSHLQALIYFVASRVFNPMGSAGDGYHEGNNYAARYENECQRLEMAGLALSQSHEEHRLYQNGWV